MANNRFRLLCFLWAILFAFLSKAQSNSIRWENDSILSWSDFMGKPDLTSNRSAISVVGIVTGKFKWNDKTVNGKIEVSFDKDSSWSKIYNDSLLLNHEQGHYDIAEIYARMIRRELSVRKYNRSKLQIKMNHIMDKYIEEENKCQRQYDLETNHYINTESQEKWTTYIHNQLINLCGYSNPDIIIRLR